MSHRFGKGLVIPAALLLLVGAGCAQRAAENTVENTVENRVNADLGAKGHVDLQQGQMQFQGENGERVNVGQNVQVPDNFPTDMPRYPAGTIVSASVTSADDASLSMTTADRPEAVLAWYETQMAGWELGATYSAAGQTTRQYKKDGVSIALMVTGSSDSSTTIILARSKE